MQFGACWYSILTLDSWFGFSSLRMKLNQFELFTGAVQFCFENMVSSNAQDRWYKPIEKISGKSNDFKEKFGN